MITLKTTLTINGITSGATGLGLVALASPVSRLFEVSQTAPFVWAGIFLILFAAYVLSVSRTVPINNNAVKVIIALDILWIIGSLIVMGIASTDISSIGIILIGAVAIWVAAMAFLQIKGLPSGTALIVVLIFASTLQNSVAQGSTTYAASSDSHVHSLKPETTTTETDALRVVAGFLDAVKERSHAKAVPLLDSLIEWRQPGDNRFSGVKTNLQEVIAMFGGFSKVSASTLQLSAVRVLAVNGNEVACLLHWNAAQPTGQTLDIDNIDVYTVQNGKIVKAVVFTANTQAEDKFWGK